MGAATAVAAIWYFTRANAQPLRFETAKVERGKVVAKVTASGTLSALVTVQVGSQVSGRIESLKVDFGSQVKKGDVIATIEQRLFRAAQAQARANYVSAQAALERANAQAEDNKRQFERAQKLAEQNLVSHAERDSLEAQLRAALAQVRVAEASIEQARAGLDLADANLNYATITSPIDGVVISRTVDVGQTVAASFQSPTLFTIAQDLKKMQVDTNIAEADIGRTRPAMTVEFVVDAYPERKFLGVVRQVRDAAQTVQGVVTYNAVIDVDNSELLLKPGMTANVTFVYAERSNVLRMPNAALRFRPDPTTLGLLKNSTQNNKGSANLPEIGAGERLVWRLDGEKAQAVKVRVGLSDGSWTELLDETFHEGDTVITEVILDASARSSRRM